MQGGKIFTVHQAAFRQGVSGVSKEVLCKVAGAQPVWLEKYRGSKKLHRLWDRGFQSAVVNLQQNPAQRPMCGGYCPTLLRAGTMFLVYPETVTRALASPCSSTCEDSMALPEERPLLGKEGLTFLLIQIHLPLV